MGRKTSVYLTDDLAERVRESGVPMAELIRRGLDADEPPELESVLESVLVRVLGTLDAMAGEKPASLTRGGQDDTRSRPAGQAPDAARDGNQPVNDHARDAVPRAAGAARTRGAQPPGRRVKDEVPPAGTAVFAEPGGEAVVTAPVPVRTVDEARDQLDRAVARKSTAKGQCEHRVKSGSYCRRCERLI